MKLFICFDWIKKFFDPKRVFEIISLLKHFKGGDLSRLESLELVEIWWKMEKMKIFVENVENKFWVTVVLFSLH